MAFAEAVIISMIVRLASGAINFECIPEKGGLWEDHIFNSSYPVGRITASGTDHLKDCNVNQPLPDLLAVSILSDTMCIIFLKRNITLVDDLYYPNIQTMKMEASRESKLCLLYSLHVNLYDPYFKSFTQRTRKEENKDIEPFQVAVASDLDLYRGSQMKELNFRLKDNGSPPGPKFTVTKKAIDGSQDMEVWITVAGQLDFEEQSIHQLEIVVEDQSEDRPNANKQRTSEISVVLEAVDVHDQLPMFTRECGFKKIKEKTEVDTEVAQVKAVDGDSQLKNIIEYNITELGSEKAKKYFQLDKDSGKVTIKVSPDREHDDFIQDSSVTFNVEAIEINKDTNKEETTLSRTTSTCFFQLEDIDDCPPEFDRKNYEVSVEEHSPVDFPLPFVDQPTVTDKDLGENSAFILSLEGSELFRIAPDSGQGETTFTVRVKDSEKLDYESPDILDHKISLQVTATGKLNPDFKDVATITVHIIDVNDHLPKFDSLAYKVDLRENVTVGQEVIQVHATDEDSGKFGEEGIRYSILNNQTHFEINNETGLITVGPNHTIDREILEDHFLTVQARDDLGKGLLTTVQLHVHILDYNDQRPFFLMTQFKTVLYEEEDDMEGEITLQARDDDDPKSDNSKVEFKLLNYETIFGVDKQSGKVSLNKKLDFDVFQGPPDVDSSSRSKIWTRTFILEVQAYDLGEPSLTSEENASITVQFTDINDNVPVFSEKQRSTTINETIGKGTVLDVQVRATDADPSPNYHRITYRLYGEPHGSFLIDSGNGKLKISPSPNLAPEDYNYTIYHNLTVEATDGLLSTEEKDMCIINIEVIDINNKKPVFGDVLNAIHEVEEEVDEHILVGIFEAHDVDSTKDLVFSLDYAGSRAEGPDRLQVSLDNYDYSKCFQGVISFGPVDYEKYSQVNFTVVATDSDPRGNKSSDALVIVSIEDINDNKPEFDPSADYQISIKENEPKGFFVFHLNATDKDSGDFGLVHYKLQEDNQHRDFFQIPDPKVGILEINESPDYEKVKSLAPAIVAFDNPFDSSNSLHNTKVLLVTILDVNDCAPIFQMPNKCLEVEETTGVGLKFGEVKADDGDAPNENNSIVDYHILKGNEDGYFSLELESGVFSVNKSLIDVPVKGSNPYFTLTLMAQDRGEIPLNDTQDFCIFVKDVNNHSPKFTNPDPEKGPHSVSVLEATEGSTTVGKEVIKLEADDKDWDENNHKIIFSLSSVNPYNHFELNQTSGIIIIKHDLKQDQIPEYKISVGACDSPLDNSQRKCTGTSESENVVIIVLVKSDKDKVPKFQNRTEVLRFTEHEIPGNEINYIPEARYDDIIGDVTNLSICYRIIGGDSELFHLNSMDRSLTVTRDLDREKHSAHWILVKAFKECPTSHSMFNGTVESQDILNVTIQLIDINDQAPMFTTKKYTAGISSSENTLNLVLKNPLMAIDLDEGENAVFEYLMVGKVKTMGEYLDGIPDPPFRVDKMKGEITVLFSADKLMKGHFEFNVKTMDRAGNSDDAVVLIYLMREDQQIVAHVQRKTNDITPEFIDKFSRIMTSVTMYSFNVDNIMQYNGPRLELRDSSSTLWAHFVNPDRNTVLEPREALKIVNQHYTELSKETQEIGGYLLGAEEKVEGDDDEPHKGDYLVIMLLSATAALAFVLVVTCGIYYYKLSSSRRKLRAATAAYKTSDLNEEFALPSAVPNTNSHVIQGSNPVWQENDLEDKLPVFDIIFNNTSHDENKVDGLDNPIFYSSYDNDDEDDILDGISTTGLDLGDIKTEEEKINTQEGISAVEPTHTPARNKFDTISNLKRSEQKWRQKRTAPQPPSTEAPVNALGLQTLRKRMDYLPGLEDESDL